MTGRVSVTLSADTGALHLRVDGEITPEVVDEARAELEKALALHPHAPIVLDLGSSAAGGGAAAQLLLALTALQRPDPEAG